MNALFALITSLLTLPQLALLLSMDGPITKHPISFIELTEEPLKTNAEFISFKNQASYDNLTDIKAFSNRASTLNHMIETSRKKVEDLDDMLKDLKYPLIFLSIFGILSIIMISIAIRKVKDLGLKSTILECSNDKRHNRQEANECHLDINNLNNRYDNILSQQNSIFSIYDDSFNRNECSINCSIDYDDQNDIKEILQSL